MALYRLQCTMQCRNAFPSKQCGYRPRHETSDCITTILDDTPIVWRRYVRYLGFTIDNRLQWFPAVRPVCQTMHHVESAVRCLLARGNGFPAAFACTIYEAMALSTMHYALPI
ncbi:hypothetical protein MRX96_016525 [Rhipicephalus microplus]